MTEKKNGGKKNNSINKLLILLVILGIIIIGLIIGIVVVNSNKQQGQSEENFEHVLPEELMRDDLSLEDQVIKDTTLMMQDPNKNVEDIEKYYDKVVEDALNDRKTDLAIRIIIQKTDFLSVIEEDCGKTKDYIDNIDLSAYSSEEKDYLASYVDSTIDWCKEMGFDAQWRKIGDLEDGT